jgi:pimeloyl-ACP methyl ester carboxylesterase
LPPALVCSRLTSPATAQPLMSPVRTGSAAFAAEVAEIAAARVGDGAVLVGHSMGAAVCLEAARILRGAASHVIGLDALLFPELFGAHVDRFFVAPYDPAVRERVIDTMRNTARAVLADSVASVLSWGRDQALAASSVPVSILYAARVDRPRQVSALQPRCSFTPFASGGHFFFMEYPADTATAIQHATGARSGPDTGP